MAAAGPFTCQACGNAFDISPNARARYPDWTPKQCNACRAPKDRATKQTSTKRPPPGVSRELNLPLAEVLLRFHSGPDTGVFTDGSCSGNPGPGGWGAVRVRGGDVVAQQHGSEPWTTNNRMEFTAVIAGLEMLDPVEEETVYSDSQLVVNTLMVWAAGWEKRGWKRKEGAVKNLDLVQRAWALKQERPAVRIAWIRAHDGSRWNEYADSLSTAYSRDEL